MAASTPTIAAVARDRANNFDVLRLLAAVAVLVSHSYALVGREEPHLGGLALGTLGVAVFFAISGFLIARSWEGQPRLVAFALKRGLRILPALIAAVIVSAYVLGPLATSDGLGEYLTDGGPIGYVLGNIDAVATGGLLGHLHYTLPGVFAGNPAGDAVNGSLWTLPIEVQGYVLVLLLGLIGLLRGGLHVVAGGGLVLLAAVALGLDVPVLGGSDSLFLLSIFAVGGLLWVRRDLVPLRADLAIAGLVLWGLALASSTGAAELATAVVVPYVALVAAYRTPAGLRAVARHGDVSYGLYLLAFPVQQSLIALWAPDGLGALALIALALPITYALAFVSWRLVEAPALRLKPRHARPEPAAEAKPLVAVQPSTAPIADAPSVVSG